MNKDDLLNHIRSNDKVKDCNIEVSHLRDQGRVELLMSVVFKDEEEWFCNTHMNKHEFTKNEGFLCLSAKSVFDRRMGD